MDPIYFYLPDFYYHSHINLIVHEMMYRYPEFFYKNIEIGAVYGCFPGTIWNGGRVVLGSCTKDQMKQTIQSYNERGIAIRYTYTNPVLEEKHLYDTYSNLTMELANDGRNEVLVNSPILEEYIRKNYPEYPVLSSTTKCLTRTEDIEEEVEKDYHLVVLDNSLNNTEKLFELPHKRKYELVANSYCRDCCPNRKEHYKVVGQCQLDFTSSTFDSCKFINRDFYEVMQDKKFITIEDIFGKYYEAGFRHYKLDGRAFNQYQVVESYMYYLVKPEYRDIVRLSLLKTMDRF